MNDFMKTILNAIQSWTKKEIKNSTSDWNQNDVNQPGYVKNRTHWDSRKEEKVNITFDGNIDGKEYIDLQGDGSIYFVKVSDLTPSTKEVIGGTISGTEMGNTVNTEITEYDVISDSEVIYYIAMTDNSRAIVVFEDFIEDNITLTKGIWFFYAPNVICINILSYDAISGELKKIDEKYLPEINLSIKMDVNNPVGTGSFSMNREVGTTVGEYSHAVGYNTTASGQYSHAEGIRTEASGLVSHAEGNGTTARGTVSHAEGFETRAYGQYSHAEGCRTGTEAGSAATIGGAHSGFASHAEGYGSIANGPVSHAEGNGTTASGDSSHAEGCGSIASGYASHAEGIGTTAQRRSQHTQGEYNILDTEGTTGAKGKYAHIVGNGTSDTTRSNAHTLDWNGVGWFQGGLQVGGNAQDDGAKSVMLNGDKEIIIASSTEGSTKQFKITVDDTGTLTVSEI